MMVVMLILSIVLAAFAPVMTTRQKRDISSPWRYSDNQSDAYFGLGKEQRAMIGQKNRPISGTADPDNRLTIQTSRDTQSHILFKSDDNGVLGQLYLSGTSLILGNGRISGPSTYNTALGIDSLISNTDGTGNTAVGNQALSNNTEGYENTALGVNSLQYNTTGFQNIAIGSRSLFYNKNGNYNSAIGLRAMYMNESGNENVALGVDSLYSNKEGSSNTAVGVNALYKNTAGSNTAVGSSSLYSNTTGFRNTAIGGNSLYSNENGSANIAIGASALFKNSTGSANIAVGSGALYYNTADDNVAVGNSALHKNTTGWANVALGAGALYSNTTGDNNVAIGNQAMSNNSSGDVNIAIGYNVLVANTSGYNNTASGHEALYSNTEGYYNTAFGSDTLHSNTTGYNNTALGYYALANNTKGNYNTGLGYTACSYVTGSYKTCIGAGSGPAITSDAAKNDQKMVFLGEPSNASTTVVGNLVVKGTAVFDGEIIANLSSGTYRRMYFNGLDDDPVKNGHFTAGSSRDNPSGWSWYYSDSRLKHIGAENKLGLEKIQQLKVYNYTFKEDKKKIPHVGVIAQDLQKVFPNAVKKDKDGFLKIRFEDMFYALINAVKELDAKINALTNAVKEHTKILKQLQDDNNKLKQENKELKLRLEKIESKIK